MRIKIPGKIKIDWGITFIKIEGPFGIVIKQKKNFKIAKKNQFLYIWLHRRTLLKLTQKNYCQQEMLLMNWLRLLIVGVWTGYSEKIKLMGVGFKGISQEKSNEIALKVGFSHSVIYKAQKDVKISAAKNKGTVLRLVGCEKHRVTQEAFNLQKIKYPDSYKGRGIHLKRIKIKLKKGKKENKK